MNGPRGDTADRAGAGGAPMRRYEASIRELNGVLSMLSRILDIRVTFFDLADRELGGFDVKPRSVYCASRRRNPAFDARCRACDRAHLAQAKRQRDVAIYHCHSRLLEGIVPLYDRRGAYLGAIVFGQLRDPLEPPPADGTAAQRRLYRRLPACTKARALDIGYLLKYVSEYIVRNELIRSRTKPWAERLATHIEGHLGERLSVPALAALVGRSASFIAHNFRSEFGLPPRAYLLRRRMEAARALLENGAQVQETAARLGFYDAFHFSKAFKAYWGVPPSRHRAP